MKYKKITLLLIFVVTAILLSGFAFSAESKKDSKINITSNITLTSQDNFTVKLTDSDGKALSNQEIKITFNASNGTQINKTVKTSESGEASFKLENMSAQKYSASVSFEGSGDYNGCNATQEFEIIKKSGNTSSSSKNSNPLSQSSSSASDNKQSEKVNSNDQQANSQDSNDEANSKEISSSNNNLVSVNSPLGANPLFA